MDIKDKVVLIYDMLNNGDLLLVNVRLWNIW